MMWLWGSVKCQVVRHVATGYCRIGVAKAVLRSKRQVTIGCDRGTKIEPLGRLRIVQAIGSSLTTIALRLNLKDRAVMHQSITSGRLRQRQQQPSSSNPKKSNPIG
jgi:hypothetical protein